MPIGTNNWDVETCSNKLEIVLTYCEKKKLQNVEKMKTI